MSIEQVLRSAHELEINNLRLGLEKLAAERDQLRARVDQFARQLAEAVGAHEDARRACCADAMKVQQKLRARVAELEAASTALLTLVPPAPSCQPYGYGKEKDEPPCYLFRIPTDVIDRLREVLDK